MDMPQKFAAGLLRQRDVEVFTFTVTACELLAISRVERFGQASEGVNRQYDENHALRIAEAMVRPETVMLDSICGDLRGGWGFDGTFLLPKDGAYLSIDDGQHRRGACEVLSVDERRRWSFPVVATKGLDFETRLKIFRQQKLRKNIDSRLDLAMRYRLNDWRSDAERQAYELVLRLNSDPGSPLTGMIVLGEQSREYKGQYRTTGINANGLWGSLRSLLSKGSPLYSLPLSKRVEVATNLILVASEVWSRAWGSESHVLSTGRGINAVLMLVVSGTNFRVVVGEDFRVESLRGALGLASRFNWTVGAHKRTSQREMTAQLDAAIGRAHQRALERGDGQLLA